MSNTDKLKRVEIFLEFLYYVFDSLLIPLIRSNFYVTDSGKHKYRLFYFRHDVWRRIAEPATAALKSRLLEEINTSDAKEILASRTLGTSHLRLLPKDSTLRPIMNLRRRAFLRGERQTLGPSINSILAPVHSMLSLEKVRMKKMIFPLVQCWIRTNVENYRTEILLGSAPLYSLSQTCTRGSSPSAQSCHKVHGRCFTLPK